jgi:hypothetical protein
MYGSVALSLSPFLSLRLQIAYPHFNIGVAIKGATSFSCQGKKPELVRRRARSLAQIVHTMVMYVDKIVGH